jgi:hypothetical protein
VTNSILSDSPAASCLLVPHAHAPLPDAATSAANISKSLLGARAGEFVLRINAGPQAGRTIRLSSPKCTIGSAANCTLRLRGKGIDPVHCVVLHGERQTVVRHWAGDTFINDHRFEDQALRAGDRLAIGALEFQVVSLPGRPHMSSEPIRNFELEAKLDKLLVSQLTARLDLANRQARRRLRAVIGKLRKFQIRMSELETRRRSNTQEQEQLTTEKVRLAALEAELQARAAELDQKRAATAAEDRALVEQAEKLRAMSKQWNQDRAAAQKAHDQKRLELDAASARLAGETARIEADRKELTERAESLASRAAESARRDEELNVRAAVLERCVGKLKDERREIEGRASELAAVAEQQANRDAELTQLAASIRNRSADFETRFAERERLVAERETEVAGRISKLLERERNEVARAQSQADALARQWAVIQAVADQQKEAAGSYSASSAELDARTKALDAQAAEVAKSAAALEQQAADVASRRSALIETSRELDARAADIAAQEAALKQRRAEETAQAAAQAEQTGSLRTAEQDRREAEYHAQLESLGRQSEEVARRCESLKQNWAELNERERKLAEREAACRTAETAVVEAQAKLAAAQEAAALEAAAQEAARQAAAAAISAAPIVVASLEPAPVDASSVDMAAVDQLMNDLTAREAEIRALNERIEQLTLTSGDELKQAAAARAELEAELQAELASLRLRDQDSQTNQAAMLEAATIYEAKLAELTAELESLRKIRLEERDEREQKLARAQAECEAVQREAQRLREELSAREQAEVEMESTTEKTFAEAALAADSVLETPAVEALSTMIDEEQTADEQPAPTTEVALHEGRTEETEDSREEPREENIITDEEFEVGARRTVEEAAIAEEDAAESEAETETEESSTTAEAAADEASAASESPKAGESAADVLRRLGMAAALDDDASHAAAPQKAPEPPRPAAPAPVAAHDHANDDESLNDYMAQLMQRLGVRNDAQAAANAKPVVEPARSMMTRPTAPAAAAAKQEETKPILAPLEPGEFKARSVAAERNSDLSALRALANANARTAITTHQIKTTQKASKWKGVVAGTAVITSAAGAYFYFTGHQEGLYCMATGVLVAVAFGLQSVGLKARASKSTRSLDDVLTKSNAKMNAENNAAEAARNA